MVAATNLSRMAEMIRTCQGICERKATIDAWVQESHVPLPQEMVTRISDMCRRTSIMQDNLRNVLSKLWVAIASLLVASFRPVFDLSDNSFSALATWALES